MLNEQTLEFGQARLKAKTSLCFTTRKVGGRTGYLVEDELTGKFFQVGLAQYTFLSLLNGRRTVSSALEKTSSLMRQHAFDQQQVADLCKWAIESGLVETELGSTMAQREELASAETMRKATSLMNPISVKIPLFCPDEIITTANRFLGWTMGPIGALIWLIVVGYGFALLLLNADRFMENSVRSFSANDLIWFAVASVILKLTHELAHGLACKRFGGRVSSCGMLLLLLIPLPYVDVTSSWRFENKWQRILTAAAGMLCELFIAAVACIVWVSCDPGPMQFHAGNVIIAATLHTLIFNANPLMRFDGYYILSDWLEIPNLSMHGRAYVKGFFKQLYFGVKPKPLAEVGSRGVMVKAYGFGTIFWFFMISVGLSLGASSLLEGFGLLIALVGLFLWFGLPVVKFIKYVAVGTKFDQPNRRHFAVAASVTCLTVGAFLFACPSPSVVSAPLVVDYEPLGSIRARVAGFANHIHVTEGQHVEAGQLLVALENPELESELSSLLIDVAISELRIKSLLTAGEIPSVQLERENLVSLKKRRDELQRLIGSLHVVASQPGTVIASELDSMLGTYVRPGDELLSVGQPGEIQALALARQQDLPWLKANERSPVRLFLWGQPQTSWLTGTVRRINPRARDDVPHDAFAASNGGPLAVVPRDQVEGATEDGQQDMMLTEPRVPVEISLSESDRANLSAGQVGTMLIRGRDQNMASYLAGNFVRFIRKNNFRTHGL